MAELDQLCGPGRAEIATKIEAARAEGDLSENGGYHAAKDEQGQIEARILTLQHILESARVGAPPRTPGVAGPGMTVTVRFVRDNEEVTFLLASREESGSPIDVYSPLGAAINGKRAGETATFWLPNGRASTVEILKAVPHAGSLDDSWPWPLASATHNALGGAQSDALWDKGDLSTVRFSGGQSPREHLRGKAADSPVHAHRPC